MEIFQENNKGVEIFKITGSLDSNTSGEYESRIYDAIKSNQLKLIIDLKELEYIASAGIRVILKATKDLKRKNGKIILCSLQDYVREVFEIAGFDDYISIENNIEDAMKNI